MGLHPEENFRNEVVDLTGRNAFGEIASQPGCARLERACRQARDDVLPPRAHAAGPQSDTGPSVCCALMVGNMTRLTTAREYTASPRRLPGHAEIFSCQRVRIGSALTSDQG